jgi:diguanylate cyclase (GGDEF)-like protein
MLRQRRPVRSLRSLHRRRLLVRAIAARLAGLRLSNAVWMHGGALLVGAAVIAVAVTVYDMRRVVLAGSLLETENLAIVLAEQTARSIQAMDIVLREVQEHIVASGITTPEEFTTVLNTRAVHEFLRDRADRLPQIDNLVLIDAEGLRVNYSRQWPVGPGSQADRDYTKHFAAEDDHGLFISEPALSRGTGVWNLYLVRRIEGPHHEFLGMVLASVPLTAFRQLYDSIKLLQNESIVLIRRDGAVLVRNLDPHGQDRGGTKMPAGSVWHRLVASGGGYYESPGVFDRITRIVAVQPLRDYPLVVDVAVSKDIVLTRWRTEATFIAVATVLAAGSLLLLLYSLRLQFRRLLASQRQLGKTSAEQQVTLESMDQGLLVVDADRRITLCNRRAAEILRLPSSVMATRPELTAVPELRWFVDLLGLGGPATAGLRGRQEQELDDGSIIECDCTPLIDGHGWVATCQDITARRRAEQQVAFMARHDELTCLPNRASFREKVEQAIDQADRALKAAVLCLDLDNFKGVNDTLGHPVGDALLRAVAERLNGCVRQCDSVARFGGDEFAVVQFGPERVEDVAILAQRIVDALATPYEVEGHQVLISTSIGIALIPEDGSDPDVLLRNADIALYRAKAEGRGTFRLFEPHMDAMLQERRALELDLRRALENQEFLLYYQPQVDAVTHRIRGFEALMRWRHPTRGLLGPATFIPLCEETGIIVPLGAWALREACREASTWPNDIRVAVNLSAVQFGSRGLVRIVSDALRESGLAACRLELEITESVLLENTDEALAILHALRDLGVTISMDDFGTGYSSLSYLRRFPFDKIKIDQSFVRDLSDSGDAAAIVRAITGLGRSLGMATTAEGVERCEQIAQLQDEGCNELQGFYFSRPVDRSAIAELLGRFNADRMELICPE